MPLTARQLEILAVLREHAEHASEAPTLRRLCEHLGVRSHGSLRRHIRALAEAGLVEPQARGQQGIRVLPSPLPEDHLPLLERIAAGRSLKAVVGAEPIQGPGVVRPPPRYVLQVVGDSRREAGRTTSRFRTFWSGRCDAIADARGSACVRIVRPLYGC